MNISLPIDLDPHNNLSHTNSYSDIKAYRQYLHYCASLVQPFFANQPVKTLQDCVVVVWYTVEPGPLKSGRLHILVVPNAAFVC